MFSVEHSGFWGTIIGGLLAVFGGLLGYYLQGKDANKKIAQKNISVMIGFKDEIEILQHIYKKNIGDRLEDYDFSKMKYFDLIFPITTDPFIFINGNSQYLGGLPSNVRKEIMKTYMLANSLLETYRANNALLSELNNLCEDHVKANNLESESALDFQKNILIKDKVELLIDYAPMIVEAHKETLTQIEKVILAIENEIQNTN